MLKLNNIKRMGYSRRVLGILGIFLLISIPILAPFSFQANSFSQQVGVSTLVARAQSTGGCNVYAGGETSPAFQGTLNANGGCVTSGGTITNNESLGGTTYTVQNSQGNEVSNPNAVPFCNAASTCIASVVYVFTVPIMTVFAYVGAYVFDIAVQLSLNSSTYALNFLTSSWAVVRDFANMAFIFILVYLAVTIMFSAESVGTMKILATTIIMALLINFSFFITRVVIDAGNILAVQFYNAIQAPTLSGTTAGTVATTVSNYTPFANNFSANTKDLTASIMQALQAQNLLGAASFQVASQTNSGWNQFLVNLITIVLIYLSIAAILAMLAFAFLTVGFKFIIRIVALWFVIIAAPAAFAIRSLLYSKNSQPKKLWGQWLSALLQWAFYPAIFLFMFLIMTVIMNALGACPTGVSSATQCGLIPSIFNTTTGVQGLSNVSSFSAIGIAIANVAIRLGIVLIMLYYGLKVADMIVQQGTSSARAASNWVGRRLGSLTYGGAAFAARQTAGRGAYNAARSGTVQGWASRSGLGGTLGRTLQGGLKGVASARLDARGIPGAQSGVLKFAGDIGKQGKGGYAQGVDARKKAVTEQAKNLKGDLVDEQKAQAEFEKEYEEKHGEGSFDKRVLSLQNIMKNTEGPVLARIRVDMEKATTPEEKQAAREMEKNAQKNIKDANSELKLIQEAGKRKVEEDNKKRIEAFAEGVAKGIGQFSPGNAYGAAEARKLIKPKDGKQMAAEAVKKLREEEGGGEESAIASILATAGGGSGGGATHHRQNMPVAKITDTLGYDPSRRERMQIGQTGGGSNPLYERGRQRAKQERLLRGMQEIQKEASNKITGAVGRLVDKIGENSDRVTAGTGKIAEGLERTYSPVGRSAPQLQTVHIPEAPVSHSTEAIPPSVAPPHLAQLEPEMPPPSEPEPPKIP